MNYVHSSQLCNNKSVLIHVYESKGKPRTGEEKAMCTSAWGRDAAGGTEPACRSETCCPKLAQLRRNPAALLKNGSLYKRGSIMDRSQMRSQVFSRSEGNLSNTRRGGCLAEVWVTGHQWAETDKAVVGGTVAEVLC